MDRAALERYILETYPALTDNPFASYPGFQVFRHASNKKWFALVMELPRQTLGLAGEGSILAMNLKCDSRLIGSLLTEPGFFPAYHMSKSRWITLALDGSVPEEKLRILLDMGYDATAPRSRKRRVEE